MTWENMHWKCVFGGKENANIYLFIFWPIANANQNPDWDGFGCILGK